MYKGHATNMNMNKQIYKATRGSLASCDPYDPTRSERTTTGSRQDRDRIATAPSRPRQDRVRIATGSRQGLGGVGLIS